MSDGHECAVFVVRSGCFERRMPGVPPTAMPRPDLYERLQCDGCTFSDICSRVRHLKEEGI